MLPANEAPVPYSIIARAWADTHAALRALPPEGRHVPEPERSLGADLEDCISCWLLGGLWYKANPGRLRLGDLNKEYEMTRRQDLVEALERRRLGLAPAS
jgi:hypothetical protein